MFSTMKQRIYIETSVVSYLTSRPSKDIVIAGHQSATHDFWERLPEHDIFVSELVLQEAGRGDETMAAGRLAVLDGIAELVIDDDCRVLAKSLVADGTVPANYPEDALHIATAAVHGIEVIVTWNFKHINNPMARARIRRSVEAHGYACPEICSPDEFLGEYQ